MMILKTKFYFKEILLEIYYNKYLKNDFLNSD